MQAGAHRERDIGKVCTANVDVAIHHPAGAQAERDLRRNKPVPVDALVQDGAYQAKYAIQQAGPEQGHDEPGL